MQAGTGRSILEALKVGEVISGRVVEQLAGGSYLVNVRGRTLLAETQLPLLRDSVVRFQVQATHKGLLLRMLDGAAGGDRALTSNASARMGALGLSDDPAGRLVLTAFQDAGAPLDPGRLIQARAQVLAQSSTPAGPSPSAPATPQTEQALATAHALLARAGLPASPVLLKVAQHALQPGLPDLAAALTRLEPSQATSLAQALAGSQTNVGPQQIATSPAPAQALPIPAAATTAGQTPATAPDSSPSLALQVSPAKAAPPPSPTFAPLLPMDPTTALIPDPGREGSDGARRALALAGLRPGPAVFDDAIAQTPRNLATEIPADGKGAGQTEELRTLLPLLADLARQHPANSPPMQALREAVAESLLPPARLADYDLVVPLTLQQEGRPSPARLAVSHREQGRGEAATFVRVDLELSRLGRLSLRLNALGDRQLALLILAHPAQLDGLRAASAALREDLRSLGVEASIRIEDLLATDDGHA